MSLLIVGMSSKNQIKPMQIYEPKIHNWIEILLKTPEDMRDCIGLINNQLIFVTDRNPYTLARYDIGTDAWPSMRVDNTKDEHEKAIIGGRTYAVFNGQLYAIGGYYGHYHNSTNRVERWDPATDSWTRIADLQTDRYNAQSTVLNERLYVAGGRNTRLLRQTEYYSLTTQKWIRRADLNEARTIFGLTAANGYLYAVGGYSEGDYLSSVERYDPKANKWTMVCSLLQPRYGIASVYFDNRLWAFGGLINSCELNNVEQYDVERDQWESTTSLRTRMAGECFVLPEHLVERLKRYAKKYFNSS